jgi:hypothetical protein
MAYAPPAATASTAPNRMPSHPAAGRGGESAPSAAAGGSPVLGMARHCHSPHRPGADGAAQPASVRMSSAIARWSGAPFVNRSTIDARSSAGRFWLSFHAPSIAATRISMPTIAFAIEAM